MTQPPPDGPVTLREVYTLIGAVRTEVVAEIANNTAHVDKKFAEHENDHREEERRRVGLYRWAVTTILLMIGTGAAIVIPLVTKG